METLPTRLPISKILSALLFVFLVLNCFNDFRSRAQLLPQDEVQALGTISAKLQIKNLNFNRSFCSSGTFQNVTADTRILAIVNCSCIDSVCHITGILLKGQNLAGTLPAEFANLTHLVQIDLSRNYISGPIPTDFARLPLTILSLLGNRLNGSIPEEIGEIATLQELVLEDNLLGGPLPQTLGNLRNLSRLILSGNNFTGTIPETFSSLQNLTDFRIDGSMLSGNIPDLLGSWTKIDRLNLQGISMYGPIPSTISQLKNITELRISNLNGPYTDFPDLSELTKLRYLVLRNCLIIGPIPDYIGQLTSLKLLDLSFNLLAGQIPATFQRILYSKLNYMFLNNNSLSGPIPNWLIGSKEYIDISYNNFIGSPTNGCPQSTVNLVSTIPAPVSNSIPWCMNKDLRCPGTPKYYSLFINCGGGETTFEGHQYEQDLTTGRASNFFYSPDRWACSTTGVFTGNERDASYQANNTFSLNLTGADFYRTARIAPTSLRYYGLCLRKGSYKVRLHFAEIMFSEDQTFSSLGRRIFDVSIQGNVVLKDFNIAETAKGVGKGITMYFNDVTVHDSTLAIHLYWSGKGTTSLPERAVYGPLISAISVTPNFDPHSGRLSVGAIVGIVAASCVVIVLILILLRWKGYICAKELEDRDLKGLDIQTGSFSLKQIKAATNNFDAANKIGEGGFGSVYKGFLSDGTVIAVKQLSSKSKQGNREFVNEIGMISALQHPHLVKLYGCCVEGNQLLLVYEYMENNSLARALFGPEESQLRLDWPTRHKICIGIARGLAYLHEESTLKIVHRDIKATNVLLDNDLNPKISDFGLAKLNEEENTHISTRIAGTYGYMAPEYAMWGYLTDKADVYSFGIVALEIVCGRSAISCRTKEDSFNLLPWALDLNKEGKLMDLVDPRLGSDFNGEEAKLMIDVALLCTNATAAVRPSMSSVVSILEQRVSIQDLALGYSSLHDEEKQEKMVNQFQHYPGRNMNESLIRSSSGRGPWTASTSSSDLYPINPNSEYWQKRD